MANCEHIAWLQSVDNKESQLRDGGRMKRVLEEMPRPSEQCPSIVFFIGQKAKNTALHELFPFNNVRRGRRDGFANLRLDNATINSDRPIWFADSDPFTRIIPTRGAALCHESNVYSARWAPPSEYSMFDILHARVFFLFTDVICIFADDFDGLENVAKRLVVWASIGSASSLSKVIRPKVVIVTSANSTSPTHNILETEDFRFNLCQKGHRNLMKSFSSISLLYLPGDHLSRLAQHRQLRESIVRDADQMREVRSNNHSLFTALHLHGFCQKAIVHAADTISQPFNFIFATREGNMVLQDFRDHLMTAMKLGTQFKLPYDALSSYIASCMVMDAYPPGMHCEYSIHFALISQH